LEVNPADLAKESRSRDAASGFDKQSRQIGRGSDSFGEPRRRNRDAKPAPALKATPLKGLDDVQMQRFRLDVGKQHQVTPRNIVGAIANEAELESKYIGEIEIREHYSTVDLPADMPKEILAILKKARVASRPLAIKVYTGESQANESQPAPRKKSYNSRKDKSQTTGKSKSDYAKKKSKARAKKKGAASRSD
jgi:ATP-dependent RNA helicase DeaD